ncbi:hypothetical protein ADEAN_000091700 [Angomonas deanei]|uniref:Uncharacterized protein n=1 Tax=Angomonas deanei TaxID=59799 RepID=A0A7G2C1G8_9TRYP|nr:hypothetical protein ADEAN_000091700 [Angomonas deanei]
MRKFSLSTRLFSLAGARLCASKEGQPPKKTPEAEEKVATEKESSQSQAEEVLNAVKKGDFNMVQTHATKLVQQQWKEEYTLPAAFVLLFLFCWYWWAWSRRSIRRKCETIRASVQDEADQTVDQIRGLTEKWKKDITKADDQMKVIIDKNSELTKDIDRMTTALRSCSIRPTSTPHFNVEKLNAEVVAPKKTIEVAEASEEKGLEDVSNKTE